MCGTGLNETNLDRLEMINAIIAAIKDIHQLVPAQNYFAALRVNGADSDAAVSV